MPKSHISRRSGASSSRTSTVSPLPVGAGPSTRRMPVVGARERHQRAADRRKDAGVTQIDGRVRMRRHRCVEHQHRAVGAVHDHTVGADLGEQFLDEALVEMAARAGFERQDRERARGDAVLEIGHAEARDRRDEDQHLADHHKKDGQHQEPGRQALQQHGSRPHQPNRARKRTIRRVRGRKQHRRVKAAGGALAGLAAGRIGHDQVGDGADLEPLRDRQGPGQDQVAGAGAEDRRPEDAAVAPGDDLDQPGGVALGVGAVVLGERPAQHADRVAVGLARRGFGQADLGQLGIGVGDPGQGAVIDLRRQRGTARCGSRSRHDRARRG